MPFIITCFSDFLSYEKKAVSFFKFRVIFLKIFNLNYCKEANDTKKALMFVGQQGFAMLEYS